jgi:hypothetical protein
MKEPTCFGFDDFVDDFELPCQSSHTFRLIQLPRLGIRSDAKNEEERRKNDELLPSSCLCLPLPAWATVLSRF